MELVITLHNKITATLQSSIVIIKLLSIIQMTTSLKICAIIPDLFISIFYSTLIPKINAKQKLKCIFIFRCNYIYYINRLFFLNPHTFFISSGASFIPLRSSDLQRFMRFLAIKPMTLALLETCSNSWAIRLNTLCTGMRGHSRR